MHDEQVRVLGRMLFVSENSTYFLDFDMIRIFWMGALASLMPAPVWIP